MGLGRVLAAMVLSLGVTGGALAQQATPPAPAKEYNQQILVPGSWFHGVHGLAFNKDDQLFAGSVIGQSIYRVQVDSGEVDRFIGEPNGMADDIAFADDGTMAWTAFLLGKVFIRKPERQDHRSCQRDGRPQLHRLRQGWAAVRVGSLPRRCPVRDRSKNVDKPEFKSFPRNDLRRIADKLGRPERFRDQQERWFPLWAIVVQGRGGEDQRRKRHGRGDRLRLQDAGRRQPRSPEPGQPLRRRHRQRFGMRASVSPASRRSWWPRSSPASTTSPSIRAAGCS